MKNPFAILFKTQIKLLPKKVKNALETNFPGAMNVEWEHKKTGFEAIFYLNDVEHISLFSEKGILLENKKNLWPNEIPENITAVCITKGEIMNGIVINHGDRLFYEIIIRDTILNRYLLLFEPNGTLMKTEKL
jgi:hypothetical protein